MSEPGIVGAAEKLTIRHSSLPKEAVSNVAVQSDWLERDLYAVLGVAEDADSKTISRAYRKLARQLHPDTHPDDPAAAERFKGVTAAYDVLGDEPSAPSTTSSGGPWLGRAGPMVMGGSPSSGGRDFIHDDEQEWATFDGSRWTTFEPGDLDDLLSRVMGRTRRPGPTAPRGGDDLEAGLGLSFEDAVRGLTTQVTLTRPDGPQTFKVRVPPGVNDGQRIRLRGKGGPGINGGPPGDLYAVVHVAPHPVFDRSGLDLMVEAPIGWPEAVLGAGIDVPTFGGPSVRVRVPAGTPNGRTLRVRGHGVLLTKLRETCSSVSA